MADRRQFLAGILASGLMPMQSWADAGSPKYLSAAVTPNGDYVLFGIGANLDLIFQLPLPARGHAAAAHPTKPIAVTFARRPGTFAVVINCIDGSQAAVLDAPKGRHFYGHGVFSRDGRWLFTTENDYEVGRGVIGVWDSENQYQRADEFESGGIGPHDLKRLPNSDVLVVANGGIDTHPESGRVKLNIPTMASNLSYLREGIVVETHSLGPVHQKNSIRHLAVSTTGGVAFGMQWQGQGQGAPETLVGFHKRRTEPVLASVNRKQMLTLKGYVGSIAFRPDDRQIVVTSPVGGVYQHYDVETASWLRTDSLSDVCGVASGLDDVLLSNGQGQLIRVEGQASYPQLRWDNHLIAI